MLLPTINVADDKEMTAFDVDLANLPRKGDHVEMQLDSGDVSAVWEVEGIVWTRHPERLKPKAIRLRCVRRFRELRQETERLAAEPHG